MRFDLMNVEDAQDRCEPPHSAHVQAEWHAELTCDCPACGQYVDLLEYPDFWDGRKIEVCEHGTDRTRGMEVVCPNCGAEFLVDCNY